MEKHQIKPGILVKHYKHNPAKDKKEYTYKIIGIAKHTEDEEMVVIYKPLYDSPKFEDIELFARPLKMFCEKLEWKGEIIERFEILKS